jgi:hypothetical protein
MVGSSTARFVEKRLSELQLPGNVMKGFALFFSLMFVLLLTLLGFCLLLLASQHYAVTHHLLEKENSRLACESAVQEMVSRHNLTAENPRFFFDPQNWSGSSLHPYLWNSYSVSAELSAPWSATASNSLVFTARKANFASRQSLELRQLRLEDFAFYSEQSQQLALPSLLAGPVFVRGGLQLLQPVVRFLGHVYSPVDPAFFASFKNPHAPPLDFPPTSNSISSEIFRQWTSQQGIVISGNNPVFWRSDHYEVTLDDLHLEQTSGRWKIWYAGILIGQSNTPLLCFEGPLSVRQNAPLSTNLFVDKPKFPVYAGTTGELRIETEVGSLEDSSAVHPLALISGGATTIASGVPNACRINAFVLALGSQPLEQETSLIIEQGGSALSEAQKQSWLADISNSQFMVEDEKRSSLLQSLESGEKIVWFQRTVFCNQALTIPGDLKQLHFQSSKDVYPLIPSFPFVVVVQGSRQWL